MTARHSPARQLRLPLRRAPSDRREDFIVSSGNAAVVAALDGWRSWIDGRLALIGPEGSGKTHLARAWARKTGALTFETGRIDVAAIRGRPVLVEDVDRRPADTAVFHMLNMTDSRSPVLFTGRTPPNAWPTDVPDLRSRLNALMVAQLEPPDDDVLRGVLEKFFRERNIKPEADVVPYLIRRIERAVPAAFAAVALIDEAAAGGGREVTRALAREVLGEQDQTIDLFE